MTFADIRTRLKTNSWIIIVFLILSNIVLVTKTGDSTYLASTTVGLNINNSQYQNLLASSNNFAQNTYDQILESFSLYLSNRFTAPDIQSEVARNAGIGAKIDTKKPFYEVKNQSAGFVNISYGAGTTDEGNRFNQAIDSVFEAKIIPEWNKNRPQLFQVETSGNNKGALNSSVIEVKPPLQNLLLPSIIGFILGVLFAIITPTIIKIKKKSPIDNIAQTQSNTTL